MRIYIYGFIAALVCASFAQGAFGFRPSRTLLAANPTCNQPPTKWDFSKCTPSEEEYNSYTSSTPSYSPPPPPPPPPPPSTSITTTKVSIPAASGLGIISPGAVGGGGRAFSLASGGLATTATNIIPSPALAAASEATIGFRTGTAAVISRRLINSTAPAAEMIIPDHRNPFVNGDSSSSPLVRTAQGGSISGGSTIGFRTGGAQDIENYRENIKNGYLPLPTDITYEGIVKDYYFDTTSTNRPNQASCDQLFCPTYSAGITPDPLVVTTKSATPAAADSPTASNKKLAEEVYLAVGLDSNIKQSDFARLPLNIVVLLDYSGSMESTLNSYYYDVQGKEVQLSPEELQKSKMDLAKETVKGIVKQLNGNDSVSIALFSTDACVPFPLTPLPCFDVDEMLAGFNRDVNATQSTNMAAGLDAAYGQLGNCTRCMEAGFGNVENRVIVLTDAQPNEGDLTTDDFKRRLQDAASKNIFTTFIGVGLDFNTELIEAISSVKGANYLSIYTPGEFQKRLVSDFDYLVTPLVFNLKLQVGQSSSSDISNNNDSSTWRILQVYGSPNPNDTADAALTGQGTIMNVNTLFPSQKNESGTRGGVVLLRMLPPAVGGLNAPLTLSVSYQSREGKNSTSQRTVQLPSEALAAENSPGSSGGGGVYWDSTGVRKAVLLARYSDMMRNWLIDDWRLVNDSYQANRTVIIPGSFCNVFPSKYCPAASEQVYGKFTSGGESGKGCELQHFLVPNGCILPSPVPVMVQLGQWERTSVNLTGHVNADAKQAMSEFLPYMQSEIAALNDALLNQEVDIINKVISS